MSGIVALLTPSERSFRGATNKNITLRQLFTLASCTVGVFCGLAGFGYLYGLWVRKSSKELLRELLGGESKGEGMAPPTAKRGGGGGGGGAPSQDLAALSAMAPPSGSQISPSLKQLQQTLVMLMTAANQQLSKTNYEKALELYEESLRMIPPNIPQYDDFVLDIVPKLVTCLLELNRAEDADAFMRKLEPTLSQNPETLITFNFIRSQVLDYLGSDAELEALLLDNMNRASSVYGMESEKYISQLFTLGMFLLRQKKYNEAIKKFLVCLDFHSSKGSVPSQEEIGIYRQLQRCYLHLGNKEEAINILNQLKLLLEDPITISWQTHHTAGLLLESELNDEAEELFKEIFDDFPIPNDGEFDHPRVKALVSNTVSELAEYLYNVGRTREAEEYFELLRKHRWGVLSSSIYMVAKSANIYFAPKPDNAVGFIARLNCEFSVSKRLTPGMFIEFESETLEGKDSSSVEIQPKQITIKYAGKNITQVENKVYTVVAKIYSDKSKSQLLFTHFQLVPSSIDTTQMKSWAEVEAGFKAKKN